MLNMDPTTRESQMDALFQEWREKRNYQFFSNDGILIVDEWEKSSPKIAFLLKESNDQFYEIRGKAFQAGPRSSSPVFWQNLNMWAYTVGQFYNGVTPTYEEARKRKGNLLQHVAYINLKKNAENKANTNQADLQSYVDNDWEFIERQLSLIDPDVIFCCGTYRNIAPRMHLTHLGNGVYRRDDGKLVIDFYHPSGRKGYLDTFNRLSKMLRGIRLGPHPKAG